MSIHSSSARARRTVLTVASALAGALLAASAHAKVVVVPPVTITSLAHHHTTSIFPPYGEGYADGVDMPCGSGGGTCSSSGFSAAIEHGDTVQVRFQAPAGQRFRVTHGAALTSETFFFYTYWQAASEPLGVTATPTITFENLSGPAPVQTSSLAGVGDGGQEIITEWGGNVTAGFTFTAVTFSFPVNNFPPGVPANFGPVGGSATFAFSIDAGAPAGTPDQNVMTLEPIPPQCSNGSDDDGDGFIDYPNDPGCASADDTDETKTIVVPTVAISALAHRYSPSVFGFPAGIADGVDFPCGGAGGGTCSGPGFAASIQHGDVIQMRFAAASGQRFHLVKQSGLPAESFFVNAAWLSGSDSISTFSDPVVTFESASGPAPTPVDHWAGVGNGGRSVEVLWDGSVTGDFTFTGLDFTFTVANAPPGSLLTYGAVTSFQSFSFGVGGSGPAGTPDQIVMQLEPAPPQCSNGIDDDGDGLVDYPADPGCASASDLDEHSPTLPCDDGVDNDGDGRIDSKPGDPNGDPACQTPTSPTESPRCDDGVDNDGDGKIDWDGAPGGILPDPDCTHPWRNSEATSACGLGAELALLAPLLRRLRRRVR